METFVCDLIQVQLSSMRVKVICLFSGGVLAQRLEAMGVVPIYCEKGRDGTFKALLQLRATLNQIKPDVIHTHNELSNYFTILAMALMRAAPVINTRHNMGLSGPTSTKERFFRYSLPWTRYMVACAQAVKTRFVTNFGFAEAKIQVIPNGIPIQKIQLTNRSQARAQWRSEHNYSDEDILICAVGRLNPVKNHRGLLDAFAQVKNPSAKLVLVGDGPMRAQLEAHSRDLGIESRVRFVGDSMTIPTILGSVDIFALPSLSEAHSIALLEAASAGLAVVVTNVGGNAEVVENEVRGYVVESGNVKALAQRLDSLVNDPAKRRLFAQHLLDWAKTNADISHCAKQYETLYFEK
jgi:glycosyltransferase involved in cell wall biosynthesis